MKTKNFYLKWANTKNKIRVVWYPFNPVKHPLQVGFTYKQWRIKCIKYGKKQGWEYAGRGTKKEYAGEKI